MVTYAEAVSAFRGAACDGWADLPFFTGGAAAAAAAAVDARIAGGAIVVPEPDRVLAALAATPRDRVRAVILGQDPYPRAEDAVGMSFSVPPDRPVPASLKTIFAAYQADLGHPAPANGSLRRWAENGVLLLNCSLTVEPGNPNGHKGFGWKELARQVIAAVSAKPQPMAFLLWGGPAQKFGGSIDRERHCVVECTHPSPLARTGAGKGAPHPFVTAQPFRRVQECLAARGAPPIDWRL